MFHANGLFVFQRFSPADRAGLEKMDYVYCVNGKEVTSTSFVFQQAGFLTQEFFDILTYSLRDKKYL